MLAFLENQSELCLLYKYFRTILHFPFPNEIMLLSTPIE